MLTYFSVTFSSMALWVPKVINHCIDWEQWNLCLAAYIFICLLTSHIIKAKPEANCDSVGKMIAHKNLTKAELNTSTLGYISTHECSEKCWKTIRQDYVRVCCANKSENVCSVLLPALSKCNITRSDCELQQMKRTATENFVKDEGKSDSRMTPEGVFGLILIVLIALVFLICATPCRIQALVAVSDFCDLCRTAMPNCFLFSKNDSVKYTQLMHEDLPLNDDLLDVYSDTDDLPPITL